MDAERFYESMEKVPDIPKDTEEVRFELHIDYDFEESYGTLSEAEAHRSDPETQAMHYKECMQIISYNRDDEELNEY